MYDILQLNDMLVPELKEIADQLKIENYRSLDKQELIYKILDKQAVAPESGGSTESHSKPIKRSGPRKKTYYNNESSEAPAKQEKPAAAEITTPPPSDDFENVDTFETKLSDEPSIQDSGNSDNNDNGNKENLPQDEFGQEKRGFNQRKRETSFNVEFDGIILGEGVLEMMPDGYG